MAEALTLPAGFEFEDEKPLDTNQAILDIYEPEETELDLPAGFEWETTVSDLPPPVEETPSPALQADMITADEAVTTPVSTFKDTVSKRNPESASQFWKNLLPKEADTEYGAILPFKKNTKTGEKSFAVPEFIRAIPQGIGDYYQQAEELAAGKPIEELELTPEAAFLPLALGPTTVARRTGLLKLEELPKPIGAAEDIVAKEQFAMGQQEALAQVVLGARNPTTMTAEQIASQMPKRSAQEIQAEINQLAADTAAPGAKERLAELHKELDLVKYPKTAIDDRVTELNKKITPEQFETNIAQPVQNAVDSGVPIQAIKNELVANLETSMTKAAPEDIDDIVEAALAPYTEIKIPQEQIQKLQYSPPVKEAAETPAKLLTAEEVENVLNSKSALSIRKLVDDFVFQQRFSRKYSKNNNNIYGEGELTAQDTRLAKIASAREINNNVFTSYIDGDAGGYVYDFINGVQVPNYSVRPLIPIFDTAKKGGLGTDDANTLLKAANAKSNWQRIDKDIAEKSQKISDLQANIKAAKTDSERAILRGQLDNAKSELREASARTTYMTREEVDKVMDTLGTSKAGDTFLTEMKAWTDSMLNMSVRAGNLAKNEADAMKAANKQYLPEMRFVEDFGASEGLGISSNKGTTTGIRTRDISSATYNVNPIENLVTKLGQIEHAALRNEERVNTLYWNLEHMDDAAFEVIYQQPKQKVLEVIEKIKTGSAPDVIDGRDLVTVPKGDIPAPTNFSLYIDGHRLDLTIKNEAYREALLRPRIYQQRGGLDKWMQRFAFLTRNSLTTWNPIFQPAAAIKGAIGYRANIPSDLRGLRSEGTKSSFSKIGAKIFTDPEYYEYLKANISPGVLKRGLKNTDKQELIEAAINKVAKPEAKGLIAKAKQGTVRVAHSLEEWAEFNEMVIRGRAYEESKATLLKSGRSPEDAERIAIRVAKNLETNYFAHGSGNAGYDFILNATPFLRTRINGSVKAINSGIHRPKEVAKGIAAYTALLHATNVYNRQYTDENGVAFVDKLDPTLRENYWHIYLPGAESVNDRVQIGSPFNFIRLGNATEMWADKAMKATAQKIYDNVEPAIQDSLNNNPVFKQYLQNNGLEAQDIFSMTMDLMLKDFDPYAFQSLAGLGTLAEVATNTDSFGQPIIPPFMQEYDPYLQVVPQRTSASVLAVSNYLAEKGITVTNPTMLTYIIQDVAGNVGALMLDGADSIYSVLGEVEQPQKELGAIPGVKRFTGFASEIEQEGIGSQYSNSYKELKPIITNYNALKSESVKSGRNMDRFLKYQEKYAEELALYEEVYKPVNEAIRPLYEELARLSGATGESFETDTTPERELTGDPVKRDKINAIRRDIIEYQRGALHELYDRRDSVGDIWTGRLRQGPTPKAVTEPFLGDIEKPNSAPKAIIPEGFELEPVQEEEGASFWDMINPISSANAAEIKVPDKSPARKAIKEFKEDESGQALQRALKKHRVNHNEMMAIILAESTATANPKNGWGYAQMLPMAWKDAEKMLGRKLDRSDPDDYADAAVAFYKKTRDQVQKIADMGGQPPAREVYIAYNMGVTGYKNLRTAKPTAIAEKVVGEKNAKSNPIFFYKDGDTKKRKLTVEESINEYHKYIDKRYAQYNPPSKGNAKKADSIKVEKPKQVVKKNETKEEERKPKLVFYKGKQVESLFEYE